MKAKKRYLQVHTLSGYKGPPFRRLICRFAFEVAGHAFQMALTENWEGSLQPYCITHVFSGKQLGPGVPITKPRNNYTTRLACIQYVWEQVARTGQANFIARILKAEAEEALEPITPPEGISL